MNEAKITSHLFSHAKKAARRLKYVFLPGAAQDLREHFQQAAKNILKIQKADPSIPELALLNMAEIVVVRIIDEMIAESRRIPGYAARNPGQLDDVTCRGAFKQLCPIWPFC